MWNGCEANLRSKSQCKRKHKPRPLAINIHHDYHERHVHDQNHYHHYLYHYRLPNQAKRSVPSYGFGRSLFFPAASPKDENTDDDADGDDDDGKDHHHHAHLCVMLCDDRGNILRSVTWFLFSQTYQSLLFLVRCQIHWKSRLLVKIFQM